MFLGFLIYSIALFPQLDMQTICSPAYAEEGCKVNVVVHANNMPVTYVSMRRLSVISLHGSALTVPLLNTVYLVRAQNCLSSGVNCSYHLWGFFEEVTLSLGARTFIPTVSLTTV